MPDNFFDEISDGATIPVYHYFDGKQWKDSGSGNRISVMSPVDNSTVGDLQVVTPSEMNEVLRTARQAQKTWENTPLYQRAKIVHLAADWLRHFESNMTELLVREIGKTVEEAKNEIFRSAELTDYFADEVQSLRGESLDSDNFPGYEKGRIAVVERVAHGVVLAIAPFNYPVNLAVSKIAPALLMGNSVVFKPPTQGGISGLHLVRIFQKAGIPTGVITCVTGGGSDVGNYLVSHGDVSMIAFTGSSEVGVVIASKTAMKPMLFECGGNNAAFVFPDADLTLAAKEIIKGGFSYAGQRCTAIKYVVGTQSVLDMLLPIVLENMDATSKLERPLISENVAKNIEVIIKEAVAEGAEITIGGKRNNASIEPTILSGVTPGMKIVSTEVFGPVISFVVVSNMDEAAAIVNGQRFGLQACVFTKDEGTGLQFAKHLDVGTVQINGSPQRGPDHFPFLGVRDSGIGVQGVRYSLDAMSRLKSVVINTPQ